MTKKGRIAAGICVVTLLLLSLFATLALANGRAEQLLRVLSSTDFVCSKPSAFGSFHLTWLFACILFSALCGVLGWQSDQKTLDRAVVGAGIVFLLMEVYKQLYSCFVLHGGNYDFSVLPFQFCSLPLYLCLLLPFLHEGRLKDMLYKFLALFGTMGGCLVMGYPAFYTRVSLCVHTMLWHTVMIALGVFILFSRGYGKSWRREVLPASLVFLVSVVLATILNVTLSPLAQSSPAPLNLYYMSPYEPTRFWVVSDVQKAFGWLPSLLCYILLFIFVGATLVFWTAWLIRSVISHIHASSVSPHTKNEKI